MAFFRINESFFRLSNELEALLPTKEAYIAFLRMLYDSANGATFEREELSFTGDLLVKFILKGVLINDDGRLSALEWMKKNDLIEEESKPEEEKSILPANNMNPSNGEAPRTIETEAQDAREDLENSEDVPTSNDIQNFDKKPQHRQKRRLNTKSDATDKKRSRFRFSMIGLKPGDEIYFVRNPEMTVKIYDDRKVLYEHQPITLGKLAAILCNDPKCSNHGPSYFGYDGVTIRERIEQSAQRNAAFHHHRRTPSTSSKPRARSRFRFSMIGLKPGDEIYYKNDPDITVKIGSDNEVLYNDKLYSLRGLAELLLERPNGHLPGPSFFCYEGKTLEALHQEAREKRDDTESNATPLKRPRFQFSMIGLKPGDEVYYKKAPAIVVKIHDDRHVLYKNSPITLSKLAAILHDDPQGSYRGSQFFCYDGETLDEIRTQLESEGIDFDDLKL